MRRRVDDGRHGLAAGDAMVVESVERAAIGVVVVIVALTEGGAGGNGTRARVSGRRRREVIA